MKIPVYKTYQPKTILNTHKHSDGGWFWDKYSAVPYVGCEWACEYCYWRDEKYNPHKPSRDPEVLKFDDAFSQYIKVKESAPELLRRALTKKPKDLIYLDCYQPIDSKFQYVRKMLEVCLDLGFPVFINEKSPMLLRDIDLFKEINGKSYLNVGWSIIATQDDPTRRAFEPKAPPVSARFAAMKKLAANNIMTGTVLMPVLPYIYDSSQNIEAVVKKTKEAGGQYVLDGGLTLWGYTKTHFYKALKKYDPGLLEKYDKLYADDKAFSKHQADMHQKVIEYCQKYELSTTIPRPVNFYPEELQVNKRIAEKFYLEARELNLSGQRSYREWTYRKVAWALDDLTDGLSEIYRDKGVAGILEIKGIGKSLATQIEKFLEGK